MIRGLGCNHISPIMPKMWFPVGFTFYDPIQMILASYRPQTYTAISPTDAVTSDLLLGAEEEVQVLANTESAVKILGVGPFQESFLCMA